MHGNEKFFKNIPIIGKALADTANNHLEHHKEVNMDMTLTHSKLESKLFFGWETLIYTSLILMLFGIPVKYIMKMDKFKYVIYISYLSILYTVLWNNIHVDMHGVRGKIGLKDGIPNSTGLLSRGPLYRYLWKYHAIHHLQKGGSKGNFNIVLPGTDYLFGTYNGFCYDNTEYCRNTLDGKCQERLKNCIDDKDVL
jgi:sterol desaturase/sphingolipid hydroxylase (fatty acid hydroxylase superfamily)